MIPLQIILFAFALTIVIELAAWKSINVAFERYSLKRAWLSIIAINIVTNPALNILLKMSDPLGKLYFLELMSEMAVILIESGLLYMIYKKDFRSLFCLSAIINLSSYGIGLLLFTPNWL